MRVAIQMAGATDPRVGTIDMGMIGSGRGGLGQDLDLDLARWLADQLRKHVFVFWSEQQLTAGRGGGRRC